MSTPRALVIGAGPAGLAATATLARHGTDVVLVDRHDRAGGQIARQHRGHPTAGPWAGLIGAADHPRTTMLAGTSIVALRPSDGGFQAVVQTAGRLSTVHAGAILLATGAREVVTPFPGWTLPGVVTAGAVQALLKREGSLPWQRIGLAGSGPLLLAVAQAMRAAGHPPAFTLERQSLHRLARHGAVTATAHPGKAALFARLAGGARVRFGWQVTEAVGTDAVTAVVIARTRRDGTAGDHRTIAVDALGASSNLVPDVALALQLGCRTVPGADGTSSRVVVDRDQQTSVPGVFAAGELTGVGGADKSVAEGRLAGASAAALLHGRPPGRIDTLRTEVRRWRSFADALERLHPLDHDWSARVPDDTVVCRCEEVSLRQVRRAIDDGAHTARSVKGLTRTGMGMCQGATCSPLVRSVLQAAGHTDSGDLESRSPAVPVTLAELSRLAAGGSA
ncbi:NAD(P)/FAD-dependent oxidoreductase [soil metagenome]